MSKGNAVALALAALVGLPVLVAVVQPDRDPQFLQVGHWVFNSVHKAVLHVHGGSKEIDGKVSAEGVEDGRLIMHDATNGYVVDGQNVVVFGKSRLTVDSTIPLGIAEKAIGLEIPGGPYLVYPEAGTVVRLGDRPATIQVGGPVHTAVGTEDGEVWLQRSDSKALCRLTQKADFFSCDKHTGVARQGTLTVVNRRIGLVDLTAGTLSLVGDEGFGTAVTVLEKVSPDAKVAAHDATGRLPVLDPATNTLLLADTSWVGEGTQTPQRQAAPAVVVRLGAGTYQAPVSTSEGVAIVETSQSRLLTFGIDGRVHSAMKIPAPAHDVRVKRGGDGRVYVDNSDGTRTLVVDGGGEITTIDTSQAAKVIKPSPSPPVVPNQPTVPGPPRNLAARPGDAQVSLSWQAAAPNGAPVTDYDVSWTATGGGRSGTAHAGGGQRAVTIRGLTNGATYVFTVVARNRLGASVPARSAPTRPSSDVPSPPSSVTAAAQPNGTVSLNWPAANGQGNAITGYQISAAGDDGSTLAVGNSQGTSSTVNSGSGIVLGVTYTFTVISTNDKGLSSSPSPASNAVAPYGPAGAPQSLAVRGSDGAIEVTWAAPALNGGVLVDYVLSGAGLPSQTVAGTAFRYTGLANGTEYRVEVRARTRARTGGSGQVTGAAASAAGRPGTVPAVVLNSVALTGDRVATVRVTVDDRASGQVNCQLIFNGAQRWSGPCGGTQDIAVGGLAYSTDYDVYVQPSNAYGPGQVSGHLNLRTNDAPPQPVVTVSKGAQHNVAGCDSAACRWVNVTARNLAPNTTYRVTCRSVGGEGGWWNYDKATDGAGGFAVVNTGCVFGETGNAVWVTVGPYESNHLTW